MCDMRRAAALLLAICLLCTGIGLSETAEPSESADRSVFLLMCNEGMSNEGGNVGNTMMVVSVDPRMGDIRLMIMAWDTFVDYEGYDMPQLLDLPFRNNGPEETLKVFNHSFGLEIDRFASVNYLNLGGMIDSFGGVTIDITRAERNALNQAVQSKTDTLSNAQKAGVLSDAASSLVQSGMKLDEWGENTHLNGFQAIVFGWLQYDSVYNCCLRETKIISKLFKSVGETINAQVAFYTDETGEPEDAQGRRTIDLSDPSEEDKQFLLDQVSPIFNGSYHNLSDDEILSLSLALATASYKAARQGTDVLGSVQIGIFPLEALNEYDSVAGTKGHLIDKESNSAAMKEFLYGTAED